MSRASQLDHIFISAVQLSIKPAIFNGGHSDVQKSSNASFERAFADLIYEEGLTLSLPKKARFEHGVVSWVHMIMIDEAFFD